MSATHPEPRPHDRVASIERRVDAIQDALHQRGMEPAAFIAEFEHLA